MITKDYLLNIRTKDAEINRKIEKLSEIKNVAFGVSAVQISERVQTSLSPDSIGNIISEICELEKEIDNDIDNLYEYKNKAISEICKLSSSKQKEILIMKYIDYKSIYQIASELGKDVRGVKRIHLNGLKNLENIS